jgi:hypothetical protein
MSYWRDPLKLPFFCWSFSSRDFLPVETYGVLSFVGSKRASSEILADVFVVHDLREKGRQRG